MTLDPCHVSEHGQHVTVLFHLPAYIRYVAVASFFAPVFCARN